MHGQSWAQGLEDPKGCLEAKWIVKACDGDEPWKVIVPNDLMLSKPKEAILGGNFICRIY